MTKKKDPKDIKEAGRPTKWTPEMNDKIIEWFSREPNYEREVFHTDKKGGTWSSYEITANALPTFSGFARSVKVSTDTVVEWAKEENEKLYPGFSVAYRAAKELQKDFLVENGLMGLYNATFTIFTAKNITDMRDQVPQLPEGTNFIGGFVIVKDSMDGKKNLPGSTSNNQAE